MFRRGGGRMIFERRAYTMNPGRVPAFDRAQVDRGFDLVRPFMERLVGYFSTRAGPADQIVHLYRYDDLEDWNARLRGLYGVPELTPYFVNTRKMVRRQVNGFFELLPFAALNPLWGEDRDWLPGIGERLAPLDGAVVVEERSFQLRPGGVPAFVDACRSGMPLMEDRAIGAFVSMVGSLHRVVLWRWFRNEEERVERYAAAGWREFLESVAPVVSDRSTLLMTPRPIPQMSPLFS